MCGISTGIYLETYCADRTSFGHLPAPLQRYEAMLPVCSESSKSAEEQLFAEDVPLQFKFSSLCAIHRVPSANTMPQAAATAAISV